jgi:hypothetical protein
MDIKDILIEVMSQLIIESQNHNNALKQINVLGTTVSDLTIMVNDLKHKVSEQEKQLNKRFSSTSKKNFFY